VVMIAMPKGCAGHAIICTYRNFLLSMIYWFSGKLYDINADISY